MNYVRLLNVARALRELPEGAHFSMSSHTSCAFHHYCARRDLQEEFGLTSYGFTTLSGVDHMPLGFDNPRVLAHFGITTDQAYELFAGSGCGRATTPIQAAKYIERFVAEHREKAMEAKDETNLLKRIIRGIAARAK